MSDRTFPYGRLVITGVANGRDVTFDVSSIPPDAVIDSVTLLLPPRPPTADERIKALAEKAAIAYFVARDWRQGSLTFTIADAIHEWEAMRDEG